MNKFDINDTTKIANDKSISVDFLDTSIYYQQYRRTLNNGGYIDIPFSNPTNLVNPSVIYFSLNPTIKYKSTNLSIFKKSHLLKNVEYDGELIIKNVPIDKEDGPVIFVCFPLKTTSRIEDRSIDKIIKMSEIIQPKEIKMNLNMNSMIDRSQKYIFYKDKNTIVVVFTNPIEVTSKFTNFDTCDLFSLYTDNYNVLQNAPVKEGFDSSTNMTCDLFSLYTDNYNVLQNAPVKEGFDSSGNMTCVPVDDGGNDVSDGLVVNYLNSKQTAQNKTIDLLFSMIMFVILFCVAFFVSPFAFKSIFIDKSGNINEILGKTWGFSFYYLIFCIALIVGGIIVKDKNESVGGVFLLLFYGISGLTIFNRWNTDSKYSDRKGGTINKSDIFNIEYLNYIKYYWTGPGDLNKRVGTSGFVLLTMLAFTIAINIENKGKNKIYINDPKKRDNATSMMTIFGMVYSIFFALPFFYHILWDLHP